MWFGRSRVQDRAADSDERGVTDDASTRPSSTRPDDSTPDADTASQHSGWVDDRVLSTAASNDNGGAIDALRAATTAAEAHAPQPTLDDITQIHRLHEMRVDAEQRSHRALAKPGARRRFQYALTAETAALRMIGFGSFDAFRTVYGSVIGADTSDTASGETIARIQELLTELGVDPHGDPLRAASEFLTTHEGTGHDHTPAPDTLEGSAPPETFSVPEHDTNPESTPARGAEPARASEPTPTVEAPSPLEHAVEPLDITDFAAIVIPPSTVDVATTAPNGAPATLASVAGEPDEDVSNVTLEPSASEAERSATNPAAQVEPEAPWIPAAQLPPAAATEIRTSDDDVLDRWIHAEARAERMHAEVDRAQAELVAMLARSADLEQTVVHRADELQAASAALDAANEELKRVRPRVEELERAIARSDAERPELERAVRASRDRITELETTLSEREQACTKAENDRAAALATAADLESTLAARTSELAQARASIAALEAERSEQAARFDHTRAELGAVRANTDELTAELETTRRALDALDAHAEAIEADLAEARRAVDNPDTRHELDDVRRELAEARHELGHLEFARAETDRELAHDRIELQQLQHTLATTRDEAIAALDELTAARRSLDETTAQVEQAERARDAITIDAAELLARAEADATNLLERANRDAEAIRQQAAVEGGTSLHRSPSARSHDGVTVGDDTLTDIVARVDRLERKLAKQRRRLDRISRTGAQDGDADVPAPGKPVGRSTVEQLARLMALPHPDSAEQPHVPAIHDSSTADVIAAAERDAEAIRQAARDDREQFRAELITLLRRLAPLPDETNIDDEW
jgi:uncharacterized coiled-coil DUF342 family protein